MTHYANLAHTMQTAGLNPEMLLASLRRNVGDRQRIPLSSQETGGPTT